MKNPLCAASFITVLSLVACGGEAVIDATDGGGGSGASTSSSSGSGGTITTTSTTTSTTTTITTTTTGPCACASDFDCPEIDDACFYYACQDCACVEVPEPAGVACMMGVCDGNYSCVECLGPGDCFSPGETCVDNACIPPIEAVCAQVCGQLEVCQGPFPECPPGCAQDLSDCSGQEIDQVAACGWILGDNCDFDAWANCMMTIPCIEI